MNQPTVKAANFTRRTANLVGKFARDGRPGLIALYYILRLSDLAREGIDRSGSYRFADHLYRNQASGRTWLGRWLDRRLLDLPASKAMRRRCTRARDEMHRAFKAHIAAGRPEPFRILTVPCGIPRDVRDFAAQLAEQDRAFLPRVEYTGVDLDSDVVQAATAFLAGLAFRSLRVVQGNALDPATLEAERHHFIASTGLGEFLNDNDLAVFYRNVFAGLAPGGILFTSAAAHDKKSDAVLRAFEFDSHYRTCADLERLLAAQSWNAVEFDQDPSGLQTFVRAIKR
jgi:putative methyltransferase